MSGAAARLNVITTGGEGEDIVIANLPGLSLLRQPLDALVSAFLPEPGAVAAGSGEGAVAAGSGEGACVAGPGEGTGVAGSGGPPGELSPSFLQVTMISLRHRCFLLGVDNSSLTIDIASGKEKQCNE